MHQNMNMNQVHIMLVQDYGMMASFCLLKQDRHWDWHCWLACNIINRNTVVMVFSECDYME